MKRDQYFSFENVSDDFVIYFESDTQLKNKVHKASSNFDGTFSAFTMSLC